MNTSEIIKIILASTVVSGTISAIISFFVSVKLKNLDYKNEYYKKILDKRLEAYKYLEIQIAVMKTTIMDDKDGKAYHMMFSDGENKLIEFQKNLMLAMSYSLWINDSTVRIIEELNQLIYIIGEDSRRLNLINVAKDNYNEVATLRKKLEFAVKEDLYNLHDINKFNKTQKEYGTRLFRYK